MLQVRQNLKNELDKMEITNLLDNELKVIVIKKLTRLQRRMEELRENANRKYKKESELGI